jgi:hypothetical protein
MRRGGYIKLFRSLADDALWTREAFTRGQAWADLLLLANYKPGHLRVRGNRIAIDRGQVGWSAERLALRWKWSRGKVNRFLNELESEQQIVQQKSFLSTVLTITNYETYQKHGRQMVQQVDQQTDSRRTVDGTADGHQGGALKKKEEVKKVRKGERTPAFVKPTVEEVRAYVAELKYTMDAEKFWHHFETRGWRLKEGPMRSWKSAVVNWQKNEGSFSNNGKPAPPPSDKPWFAIPADRFAAFEKAGRFIETHRSQKKPHHIRGTLDDGMRYECLLYPLPEAVRT